MKFTRFSKNFNNRQSLHKTTKPAVPSNPNPITTMATTLVSATSTLTGSTYQSATLTAASISLTAHTLAPATPGLLLGDTLVATLAGDSLISSIGSDSLYASGANAVLISGTGKDTLAIAATGANSTARLGTSTTVTLTAGVATTINADSLGYSGVSITGGATTLAGGNLAITNNAASLTDSAFAQVRNVNAVSLTGTGATAVELGVNAQTTGVTKVFGGNGGISINQRVTDTLASTLVGGNGADLITIANSTQLVADSIVGGSGADTLILGAAATLNDAFTRVTGVEVLSLTGGSNVSLAAAAKTTGISTVILGGSTGSSINQLVADTNATTFIGGAGNDTFILAPTQLGADSIVGGLGVNSISLAAASTALYDSLFAHVNGVQALSLTGANNLTLGSSIASAGISTIYGGAGVTAVSMSSGTDTIIGGNFANRFTLSGGSASVGGGTMGDFVSLSSASQLSVDSISGGAGVDTLVIGAASTGLYDSLFANNSSTEVLSLTGANALTLGSAAAASGIATVIGGAGSSTFNQTAGAYSLVGGAAADLFSIANSALLGNDSIAGGAGINTLVVGGSASLTDANFARVLGEQVLSLSGAGASVTLGAAAKTAGIATVLGATSVSQLSTNAGPLTIVGGNSGDAFSLATSAQLIADSILGGSGTDALTVTTAAALVDTNFNKVKGVEVLSLAGGTLSSAILGVGAKNTGFSTIFAGSSSKVTHTAADTNALTIVGAGSNVFTEATSSVLAGDSISGGAGIDTLVISSQGSFSDASFSRVSGVEVLSLTGSSAITIGNALKAAGISTILGGAAGDTFAQATTGNFTLNGGAGNDSFEVAPSALSSDSIIGGTGIDTIAFTSAGTINDSSFAKVSGVEVLQLSSSSTVTLDTNAATAGIKTIYAGNAGDAISQTASVTGGASIIGGAGNDLVSVATQAIFVADSLYGGKGVDTLVINDSAATIIDANFAKAKGFEVLSLNGGTATLGVGAAAEGFTTINIGGGNGQTLNGSAFNGDKHIIDDSASNGPDSIVGSVNTGTRFIVSEANLASSTFVGGSGSDTVAIVSGETLGDSDFANMRNMNVLLLNGAGSSVTLDSSAGASGINSIYGGTGAATISQTAGDSLRNYINGSANTGVAGNVYNFDYASLAANDTVVGSGKDSLQLNNDLLVSVGSFTNVSGVSVLSLTGGLGNQTVNIDSLSNASGFNDIIGGDSTTFNQLSGETKGFTLDGSQASGNNIFALNNLAQLAADTIIGTKLGGDTLSIGTASTISDSYFANVKNVTDLQLTGASAVTLGGGASLAGIQNVYGGNGSDTFTVSKLTDYSITGGTGADVKNVLTVTTGINDSLSSASLSNINILNLGAASNLTLDGSTGIQTVNGSSVSDQFTENVSSLSAIQIYAGGGTDTLNLTGALTNNDSFASIHNVAVLQLDGTSNILTLGSGASNAGILKVVGGAGGNDTFNQTSNSFTLDGSPASSNLFVLADATLAAGDTILGSGVADTLAIGTAGSIADSSFAHVSGITALSLTGASTLTAGSNLLAAFASGTTGTVYGGNGGDSLTESNLNDVAIVGGSGINTLTVANGITDNDLSSISQIQNLQLGGSSNVTLNGTAAAAGILTLQGSAQGDTISQTADNTNHLYINGSANTSGTGDLYTFDNAGLVSNDTVIGRSGVGVLSDTLQIISDQTGSGTFGDAQFSQLSHVSGVGALQLDDAANDFGNPSTVILGSSANSSGFTTIVGAFGNDTFAETAGSWKGYYLDGASQGTGNLFSLASGAQMQLDTLLGSGTDTLQVAGNVVDANFTNAASTGVNDVELTGSASITVGAYADAFFQNNNSNASGVGTISGGAGNDTITQSPDSNNAYFFDGSNGSKNLYVLNNVNLLASNGGDTINGAGAGRGDTLSIAQTSITDANIANVGGVDALQLNGNSDVTLGAAANNNYNNNVGFSSIFGGAGSSTITQDASNSAPYYLSGVAETSQIAAAVGAGNLFVFDNAGQLGNDTVVGGGGSDTIQINTNSYGEITDSTFNTVQNIPLLQLNGGQVVDLGTAAYGSGLVSIEGGAGSDTFNQYFNSTKGYYLDGSANTSATRNLFSIDTASEVAADTILGGLGIDTLQININSGVIADSSFANVTNVPVLQLTGNASVVIGYNADAAGLVTISGGTGNDTFTQDYSSGNNYYLDGSNDTSAIGGNLFVLDNSYMVTNDTIMGGSGIDTLQIANNSQGEIVDSTFANVSNITVLSLAGGANIDLGANTDNMNLSTINGGNGDDTFNQQAASSNAYYLDGSHDTSGSGNLFEFDNAAQVAIDTISGGSGYDTVQINNNSGGEITDSTFANFNKVSVLQLNGNQTVDLGSAVYNSGLVSIIGGAGDVTFNQSSNSAKSYYLDGSADPTGGGNLFSIDTASEVAADTIIGGSGIDTLQINNNPGVIADSNFASVSYVKTLQLTGSASVVLGFNADNAGFVSLEGGSGHATIAHDSSSVNNYYLDGSNDTSSSGGNLFILDNSSQLYTNSSQPGDTVYGGSGKDTLAISNNVYGVINDSAFLNVSHISVLSLSAGANVDLGVNADNAGIMTVSGGSGDSTLRQDGTSNNPYYLDGSQDTSTLAGNVFTIDNAAQLSSDTIRGGSGTDTLQVGNTYGTVTDSSFVQVRNVDVLQLANNGSVILGTNAALAGFGTIAGGSGDAIFTQSAGSTNHFYIDGSNDTNTLGGNLFAFDNAAQLGNDTIAGGSGVDTLQMNSAGSVTDSAFNNVYGVSLLQLTGSSSVSLGSAAQNAGIINVSGGSGTNTLSAAGYTAGVLLDNSYATGNSSILGGSGADTLYAGAGTDTLQGYAFSNTNAKSDTLAAGSGADLFILGDTTANAYGNGGVALIQNFSASDTLQLHDYSGTGSDASDYSLVSGSWGSGASAYNEQLFDISNSGSKLIANINYIGSDAQNDILAQAHFIGTTV